MNILDTENWLDGVMIDDLSQFLDERGKVQRFYRNHIGFNYVAEAYVTHINPGVIKGWHGYISKKILYACISGNVKLVLYDRRPHSPTYDQIQEVYIGQDNYKSVFIPPGVMNAFKGISQTPSVVIVCADEIFREEKTIRLQLNEIEYDWSRVNG